MDIFTKGELEINKLILLLLGLIVFAVIVYIFRAQIMQFLRIIGAIQQGINQSLPPIKTVVGG